MLPVYTRPAEVHGMDGSVRAATMACRGIYRAWTRARHVWGES
jgi:hypothetical protein